MAFKQTLVLLMSVWLVSGQRPSFAGSKPIGYPEVNEPKNELGNRFGDENPLPLPVEAKGDRALVERISKLPVDKQPFWYINWKALEENRRNPVTYEQRPNSFTDEGVLRQNAPNGNSGSAASSGSSGLNSRFGSSSQNSGNNNIDGHRHYRNSYEKYAHVRH